jgi:hypothetical protein
MDYRKEYNGWLMFHKHWGFVVLALLVSVSALLALPVFSHSRLLVTPNGVNMSGTFSRDAGSVYWRVMSKAETNQIQFVLLLPVASAMDLGNDAAWPADGNDYCDLQVKSNGHRWTIENMTDPKTRVQKLQLHDVTTKTTSDLNLEHGRFWELNDAGRATQLEVIDSNTLARIFAEVKMNETNFQAPQGNSGN